LRMMTLESPRAVPRHEMLTEGLPAAAAPQRVNVAGLTFPDDH